jgi:chemotaxis protein CheD
MLPTAAGSAAAEGEPGAKFADVAVDRLVQAMEREGAKRERMVARLVGGATMFTFPGKSEPQVPLGERNLAAARSALAALGIPIRAEDSGGSSGRSLELEPGEGTLTVWSAFQYVRWL